MKQEVVIKDKKLYIALFMELDTERRAPIYIIPFILVNDSDFKFLKMVAKE